MNRILQGRARSVVGGLLEDMEHAFEVTRPGKLLLVVGTVRGDA